MLDPATSLRTAINETAVPGAPPRLSRRGTLMGIALLEAALGMHHVRRLTENVVITEHAHARRFTEIDVNLSGFDERRRKVFSADPLTANSANAAKLWIPVARISRDNGIPIDVRDATGQRVPRMTQYESSYIVASGMYRLLRAILASHQDARESGSELNRYLYKVAEPRFLLESALATLLTERSKPRNQRPERRTPGTVDGVGARHRNLALFVLDKYDYLLPDYYALLKVALSDYLLVVALNGASPEHSLSYESPLYVEPDAARRRIARRLNAARQGISVSYSTTLPSSLRSYHLVVETAPDLEIRHLYLSTAADADTVRQLSANLRELGRRIESMNQRPLDRPREKVLELEVQSVLRDLADLVRRRRWEYDQAGGGSEIEVPSAEKLVHATLSGEAVLVDGVAGGIDNSILRHLLITPESLSRAASEIESLDLANDLSFEDDPANNKAHAYWRRRVTQAANAEQIRVNAAMLILDTDAS